MCHETLDPHEVHAYTSIIELVVQRTVCEILSAPPMKPNYSFPKRRAPRGARQPQLPRSSRPLHVPAQPGLPRGRDTQGGKLPPLLGLAPGPAGLREPPSPDRGPGRALGRPQRAPQPPGRAQAPAPAPCRPLTGRARRRPGN